MYKVIPYFDDGYLKKIQIVDDMFIVFRYYKGENIVVKNTYKKNNYYKEMLEEEYYNTLERYLKQNEIEYRISLKKDVVVSEESIKKNTIIYTIGIIGMTIPFIGILLNINLLLYLGVFTLISGIFSITISGYNLKKFKKIKQRKNFIEEYEKLNKDYRNRKKVNSLNSVKEIKSSINPVCDIKLSRKKRK